LLGVPRSKHVPGWCLVLKRYPRREGAKPQEGRQSRERPAAFIARQSPEAPPESGTVGSALGRRVGGAWAACRSQGDGGESPGGANTQEGMVRRPEFWFSGFQVRRSPPRSVFMAQRLTPLVLAQRLTPLGSRTDKPLKSRRSRLRASPGNDMRGEAPRGVPRIGGSKALKGEPQGRCGADGLRQARQGVNRREGSQTLRAEGAGACTPRVDRICCASRSIRQRGCH
jgi:hypothetical protein